MFIHQIASKSNKLKNSPLAQSPIWQKHVSQVKPFDLLIYQKKLTEENLSNEAIENIEELQYLTIMAVLEKHIKSAPYLSYACSQTRITLSDLMFIMENSLLSEMRKKAIVFALEIMDDIDDVVSLTRKDATRLKHTDVSFAIMESIPINLHLNYLFWEVYEVFGMNAPLVSLENDFVDIFAGLTFKEMKPIYKNLILVDNEQDALDFDQAWRQILNI